MTDYTVIAYRPDVREEYRSDLAVFHVAAGSPRAAALEVLERKGQDYQVEYVFEGALESKEEAWHGWGFRAGIQYAPRPQQPQRLRRWLSRHDEKELVAEGR